MRLSVKKFLKYIIVGGFSYLLDLGSLYFFVEYVKIYYLIAATLATVIATYTNYYLNKKWSFNDSRKIIKSLPKYLSLFAFNYFFMMVAMYIFVEFFGVHYLVIKVATMCIVVIWNFFLYKSYVYKHQTDQKIGTALLLIAFLKSL